MRYLGPYDVLAVAARVLRCESEDAVRRTDLDAVERVLADVRRTGGLAEAAGALLAGLVRERPFDGANRVVAVAVVLQFTALNRAELQLEPVEEVDELLDRIRSGEATDQDAGTFIRARLDQQVVTADDLQEQLRLDVLLESEVTRLTIEEECRRGVQMYERFSDPGRRVIVLAQEEARGFDHVYVGTEHLLLGLLEEGKGIAARVLAGMGIKTQAVRELVLEIVGRGNGGSAGSIPFTPRAKRTLELSWEEAHRRGVDQVQTEHLLLGLLRDHEGVAAGIMAKLTPDPELIRRKVEDWVDRRQRAENVVTDFVADATASWTTYGRRHHLLHELSAVLDENERLHEQVASLRDLLRRHNIDPDT